MAEVAQIKEGSHVDYGSSDNEDNGHQFTMYNFKSITFCSVCDGMLWGFAHQGYNCGCCDMSVHKRCLTNVASKCKMANVGQEKDDAPDSPHKFQNHNFKIPSFCNHCGSMLVGFYNQGLKCGDCNRHVHHRCGVKISRECDVAHD